MRRGHLSRSGFRCRRCRGRARGSSRCGGRDARPASCAFVASIETTRSKKWLPPAVTIGSATSNRPARAASSAPSSVRNASTRATVSGVRVAPSVPSKSATPASRRRGAAMTASATATASSMVRAPVRPPLWPSSMSTSSGRSPGTSAIAASRIATFATESAYRNSSRAVVARQPRPEPAGSPRDPSARSPGSRARRPAATAAPPAGAAPPSAPTRRARAAPAMSSGERVVFACGARLTSWAAHQSRIAAALARTASIDSVATGVAVSPRATFQPRPGMSSSAHAPPSGRPLNRVPSSVARCPC